MILKIFSFENEIVFSEDYISVLLIENRKLFRNVVNTMHNLINEKYYSDDEKIIFIENNEQISIKKEILLISDILSFDYNRKNILDAIYKYLEKQYSLDYEQLNFYQNQIMQISIGLQELFDELPFDLAMKDNVTISEFLKMLSVKVNMENYNGILEKLYLLIDLIEYLKFTKILVLVNVIDFFEEKEIQELYKYIMYKKVKVLFIEQGSEREPLKNEKIWFIDSDFDEMLLYNRIK